MAQSRCVIQRPQQKAPKYLRSQTAPSDQTVFCYCYNRRHELCLNEDRSEQSRGVTEYLYISQKNSGDLAWRVVEGWLSMPDRLLWDLDIPNSLRIVKHPK